MSSATPIRTPFAMTRAFLRRVAAGLAGVVLCAQMAVAAYACPGVASAMAGAGAELQAAAPMPNCDGMKSMTGAALDPAAPNLCAEHCKHGQQSDQAATLSVPAAVLALLYVAPAMPAQAPPRSTAAPISALIAASPPHAIAHCVFRI